MDTDFKVESPAHLLQAAHRFAPPGAVASVQRHGNGNVHDTFLVVPQAAPEARFILQRINTHVFREPKKVMANIETVASHVANRLLHGAPLGRRWEQARVLRTADRSDLWVDPSGSFWRALSFISGARALDTIQNTAHAREIGCGLGLFHSLISDLPGQALHDTLEGFHVTPKYLERFDRVVAEKPPPPSPEMDHALRFVQDRRKGISILEDARTAGLLPLRPIHGDPKVANVMIDIETDRAISLIDLDTVKLGLTHYDVGDCLRSGCNPSGELPGRLDSVRFDTDLCRAILEGYIPVARNFLTDRDFDYFHDAAWLITLELGLRFLTDYLQGNVYFKTRFPGQNLQRALVQLRLCESIESQAGSIRAIIRKLT